jgi:hypothetical protein
MLVQFQFKHNIEGKKYHSLIMIGLLSLFLIPLGNLQPVSEVRWQMAYNEIQKKALFHARSCGIRGDSEIIKRAFDYSVRFGMRWDVVIRWIQSESSFIPSATSRVDAKGLTQLMDATADYVGKILIYSGMIGLTNIEEEKLKNNRYNLYDVEDNLLIGFAYLKFLILCSENPEEAFARYLAGKRWIEFINSSYVQRISDGRPVIVNPFL